MSTSACGEDSSFFHGLQPQIFHNDTVFAPEIPKMTFLGSKIRGIPVFQSVSTGIPPFFHLSRTNQV